MGGPLSFAVGKKVEARSYRRAWNAVFNLKRDEVRKKRGSQEKESGKERQSVKSNRTSPG